VEADDGRFLPSLALAAVLAFRDAPIQPVVGPKGVQAGGLLVPTGPDAKMRLNWADGLDGSPARRSVVSASDLYDKAVDPARFTDKIVFIGATAEAAQDYVKVPIDKSGRFPGVLVHANA